MYSYAEYIKKKWFNYFFVLGIITTMEMLLFSLGFDIANNLLENVFLSKVIMHLILYPFTIIVATPENFNFIKYYSEENTVEKLNLKQIIKLLKYSILWHIPIIIFSFFI